MSQHHEAVPFRPHDITKFRGEQTFDPFVQASVEKQFGRLPEFHRLYDHGHRCRIDVYDPEEGYIRFESVTDTEGDLIAAQSFSLGGGFMEYQLLDPTSQDRVSRQAFFTQDWEGNIQPANVSVSYRIGNIDTEYHVEYDDEGKGIPEDVSIKIFSNRVRGAAGFSSTLLAEAQCNDYGDYQWKVKVAHGTLDELDAYFLQEDAFKSFPGIELTFEEDNSDIKVYDGEGKRRIDTIPLNTPKVISETGNYEYTIKKDGKIVVITRTGQDIEDKTTWEIILFTGDQSAIDNSIKNDWTHLKEIILAELIA